MKHYVLDANALIRYFRGNDGASKVANLLTQASKGSVSLSISTVNLAEVVYIAARTAPLETIREAVRKIQVVVSAVPPGAEDAMAAAEIRLQYKLALADSFAAQLALDKSATLVTADPEFTRIGKRLKILPLPRHSA